MTECPSCRVVFEEQPKVCNSCGYQFASNPQANLPVRRSGLGAVIFVVFVVCFGSLMVFGIMQSRTERPNYRPSRTADAFGESGKKSIQSRVIDCSKQPLHPKCRPVERASPPDVSPSATSLAATDLFAAYKANEVAADLKYKGQRLAVLGTIESIGKDILDTPYVSLETGEFGSVQCMFPKSSVNDLARLSKGNQITIKGTCTGKLMNVILRDCSFF